MDSPNSLQKKRKKMTLKGYYEAIPLHSAPRKEFMLRVAEKCGVSEQTVRNWCIYGMRPQDFTHVKILSEMTGIKAEDLWSE